VNALDRGAGLLVVSVAIRGLVCRRHFPQGGLGLNRRVRERSPAHSAETVLWAVVVPAMRAADVHSL